MIYFKIVSSGEWTDNASGMARESLGVRGVLTGGVVLEVKGFPAPGGGIVRELVGGFNPLGVFEEILAAGVHAYSNRFPCGSEFGFATDHSRGVAGEFVEVLESDVGVVLVAEDDEERAVLVVVCPSKQDVDGAIDEEINDFFHNDLNLRKLYKL